MLTVAPWTLRNWIVFRAFVPISTYGAFNLWLGNSDLDRDEVYRLSDSVEGPVAQYRLARAQATAAIARRQPEWIFEKAASELPALFAPSSEALVFLDSKAYGPVGAVARTIATATIVLPWLALALHGRRLRWLCSSRRAPELSFSPSSSITWSSMSWPLGITVFTCPSSPSWRSSPQRFSMNSGRANASGQPPY